MAQCNSKGRVNKDSEVKKQVKIFISHSSNDKEYVKKIVEFLENMNVPECGIFCSSVAGMEFQGEIIFMSSYVKNLKHMIYI